MDLFAMMLSFMQEAATCRDKLHAADVAERQFWRRIFTRSVFAGIEASCECFRTHAFLIEAGRIHEGTSESIAPGKLATLVGESYQITEDGEVRAEPMKISLKKHIVFALKQYAAAREIPYSIDRGSKDWQTVAKAIEVRDRITHPKTAGSFEINDDEIRCIETTFDWFGEQLHLVSGMGQVSFRETQ